MPIENNLPVIFDTATQTEDGLMSYTDKIKLDNIGNDLDDKLSRSELIKSSQLDISSDEAKIQPANLSDAVKQMMTGQASVEATVPNSGVTSEKIAPGAVTGDKLDKRVMLGNVVSPEPVSFTFDTKTVKIALPAGTMFLPDAVTTLPLTIPNPALHLTLPEQDVVLNINYPAEFDGLNYIVLSATGIISMVNYRKVDSISNTNYIMALVYLTSDFNASVVMNGNYSVNGLPMGINTDNAMLLSDGKIVFISQDGIIDFNDTYDLYLVVGGRLKETIQSQSSIRIASYASDIIYTLYWDNSTHALKVEMTDSITDTNINKIAIIKDERIIPLVNSGNFYSKPYYDSPFYNETLSVISDTYLISEAPVNFQFAKTNKVEFPSATYVCIGDQYLPVANSECTYEQFTGIHFIKYSLDTQQIYCEFNTDMTRGQAPEDNGIVIGIMWVAQDVPPVISCNFDYTIDGKAPYEKDIEAITDAVAATMDTLFTDLSENKIVAGNDLYLLDDQELSIYRSSMLLKDTQDIKTAVRYIKKDNTEPVIKFFDGDITLNTADLDSSITLLASNVNTGAYLQKSLKVNKVKSDSKAGQTVKILCLGDALVDNTAYYVKNKLTELGLTPVMLGTMTNGEVYGEGRDGWFYSTFIGASGRGYKEGKITPQVFQGASSILMNPFIRTANADDKANNPTKCYRATGAYEEKTYYSDSDKNGSFYIFDFASYLQVQGIETPDVVVIALKPEIGKTANPNVINTNMTYLKQLVAGIREALPSTMIVLAPQYASSTAFPEIWDINASMTDATIEYTTELADANVKVLSPWLTSCREFGTDKFVKNATNPQLYEPIMSSLETVLSESAKHEFANAIVRFIMNI